jgi:hypothetical protein
VTARDRYRLSPKHWHALDGLRHVETDPLADAVLAVEAATEAAGIIAFDGDPGTGKTYAIKSILENLSIPHWYLPVGPLATGKMFEVGLLREICKRREPPEKVNRTQDRSELREQIASELALERGAVLIDDFNPSGRAGIEVIRWLSEQADNRAAFILAGNNLTALIRRNPAFYSRVMQIVPFEPFDPDESSAISAGVHPFLAGSDPALLFRLNSNHVHGNFRTLAIFLEHALRIAPGMKCDRLTDELIEATIATINKRRRAITTREAA